jgi:hypothetical protein
VHLVGHQRVGVNGAAIVRRGRREPVAVLRMIPRVEEDRVAIAVALDDM